MNQFKVEYDGSKATESDVGVTLKVMFVVRFKEYIGLVADHQASFNFEIVCPTTLHSNTLTMPTSALNFYDVANPGKGNIAAPKVAFAPSVCFTITNYELVVKNKPLEDPTKIIKVSADKTGFIIETSDRNHVGKHVFTVQVVVSSGEKIQSHDFAL